MATVGILALQGNFAAHARSVEALGHVPLSIKTASDLDDAEALLLPGGESSTMLKLLQEEGLFEPLRAACLSGRPVLGTCAGAILLASRVTHPDQTSLAVLDIEVERNGYGRQRDSFITHLDACTLAGDAPDGAAGAGQDAPLEAVFIRAPVICKVGHGVQTVLSHDDRPVLVRHGSIWAATFHPEMSQDLRVLQAVLASGAA